VPSAFFVLTSADSDEHRPICAARTLWYLVMIDLAFIVVRLTQINELLQNEHHALVEMVLWGHLVVVRVVEAQQRPRLHEQRSV
jgi:hypothetical protein